MNKSQVIVTSVLTTVVSYTSLGFLVSHPFFSLYLTSLTYVLYDIYKVQGVKKTTELFQNSFSCVLILLSFPPMIAFAALITPRRDKNYYESVATDQNQRFGDLCRQTPYDIRVDEIFENLLEKIKNKTPFKLVSPIVLEKNEAVKKVPKKTAKKSNLKKQVVS